MGGQHQALEVHPLMQETRAGRAGGRGGEGRGLMGQDLSCERVKCGLTIVNCLNRERDNLSKSQVSAVTVSMC